MERGFVGSCGCAFVGSWGRGPGTVGSWGHGIVGAWLRGVWGHEFVGSWDRGVLTPWGHGDERSRSGVVGMGGGSWGRRVVGS